MSDLEKVYARADQLGPTVPIILRWEGAGDGHHAAYILGSLKHRTYSKSQTRIKFHATINLYEEKTNIIAAKAEETISKQVSSWGSNTDQKVVFEYNVNVMRDSKNITQFEAHIMFVRNIMPTNDRGESLTADGSTLEAIHLGAIRNRANSLVSGGTLELGMSGAPGLVADSQDNRKKMTASNLFVNKDKLDAEAKSAGLQVTTPPDALGKTIFVDGYVMKNNGADLSIKPTYYLTFMK